MAKKSNVSKKSAKKVKSLKYRERKEKVLTLLHLIGSWHLPNTLAERIADECNVSVRQIFRDKARILKSVPKPDIKETSGKFLISFNMAITEAISLIRSDDALIKAKGIDLYFKAVESYTRFLESYNFKDKPEEKLRISGLIGQGDEAKLMNIIDKYIKN